MTLNLLTNFIEIKVLDAKQKTDHKVADHKEVSSPPVSVERSSPEQSLEVGKESDKNFGKGSGNELINQLNREIGKEIEKYKAAKDVNERLKVSEIIERVKKSKKRPYFRPDTTKLVDCSPSLLKCIHACWEEQPESRPTMRLINRKLRRLHDGL